MRYYLLFIEHLSIRCLYIYIIISINIFKNKIETKEPLLISSVEYFIIIFVNYWYFYIIKDLKGAKNTINSFWF